MSLGMRLLEKLSMHMNKKIQINYFCKSNHWSRRMIKIREIAQRVIKIDDLNFKSSILITFFAISLIFTILLDQRFDLQKKLI